MVNKDVITLSGPYAAEDPPMGFDRAHCVTVSTYPHIPDKPMREGSPICDSFRIQAHPNGLIFCIADGCGWGSRSASASNAVSNLFSFVCFVVVVVLLLWLGCCCCCCCCCCVAAAAVVVAAAVAGAVDALVVVVVLLLLLLVVLLCCICCVVVLYLL